MELFTAIQNHPRSQKAGCGASFAARRVRIDLISIWWRGGRGVDVVSIQSTKAPKHCICLKAARRLTMRTSTGHCQPAIQAASYLSSRDRLSRHGSVRQARTFQQGPSDGWGGRGVPSWRGCLARRVGAAPRGGFSADASGRPSLMDFR